MPKRKKWKRKGTILAAPLTVVDPATGKPLLKVALDPETRAARLHLFCWEGRVVAHLGATQDQGGELVLVDDGGSRLGRFAVEDGRGVLEVARWVGPRGRPRIELKELPWK